MKEILLTSSVLILALLALRQLFRRTVSRRMQYALWLLVLVRLLVPLNVGTLAHNVLSAAEPVQAVVEERLDTPVLYVQDGTERRPAQLLPGKESLRPRAAQGAHTLPRRGLPLSGLSRAGAALAVPVRCAAPRRLPERKGAAKPRRPALRARARADARAAP